jgi:WD40 repeat protein
VPPQDCTARVWDVAKNTVTAVLQGHTDGIHTAALSPDETLLASASYAPVVRLHRLPDGAPLAILDHEAPASMVAFSPDSGMLAAVLQTTHAVVVWDLVSQACLPPLVGHKSEVTAVAFSPDGLLLATCSADCTLRIWAVGNGAGGRQVAFFMADAALSSVAWAGAALDARGGTAPGQVAADMVVAGDANGTLHFLDFPAELHPANAPNY